MGFLALLLLPKCSTDLNYGPGPLARDWVSRVSGLVPSLSGGLGLNLVCYGENDWCFKLNRLKQISIFMLVLKIVTFLFVTNKSGFRRPKKSCKGGVFPLLIFGFHVFHAFDVFSCSFAIIMVNIGDQKIV